MNKHTLLGATAAILAVAGLAACGSEPTADSANTPPPIEAPATTIVAPTTAAPTTTNPECEDGELRGLYERRDRCVNGEWKDAPQDRPAPSTTVAPTTTAAPAAEVLAWTPPAEEGIGVFSANDTVSRVLSVVYADVIRFPVGPYTSDCQRAIEIWAEDWAEKPTTCLTVFWSFDVGAGAPTAEYADEICLSPDSIVAFNHEVGGGLTDCALPGTIENTMTYTYVGATPGMAIPFDVGNNHVRQDWVLNVPDESAFFEAKST